MFTHAPYAVFSALFLALSILFVFFVVLSGVVDVTPFNKTYFLRADTSGIEGAHDTTQWTYLYACGASNLDCGRAHPAMPFGAAWASHADGVPAALVGKYGGGTTSHYYYYMWRFGWVFFLLGLFFQVMSFFTSFLACCGRLGASIGGLVATGALAFLTAAVALMTATFVKARNVFQGDGREARLGRHAFGFAWGAEAALLIALALLWSGAAKKSGSSRRDEEHSNAPDANGSDGHATNWNGESNDEGGGFLPSWLRRNRGQHKRNEYSKGSYDSADGYGPATQ